MNPNQPALAGTITRACKQCWAPLTGKRRQARYCGASCRKRASRAASAVNTTATVTRGEGHNPPTQSVSRFLRHPRASQRHLGGLLSQLAGEAPGWIESTHTGRTFPRTYAEHGLALPDYLRMAAVFSPSNYFDQ
jgi:hypothetical protein